MTTSECNMGKLHQILSRKIVDLLWMCCGLVDVSYKSYFQHVPMLLVCCRRSICRLLWTADFAYNTLLYSESKLEADSARVHAVALCVSSRVCVSSDNSTLITSLARIFIGVAYNTWHSIDLLKIDCNMLTDIATRLFRWTAHGPCAGWLYRFQPNYCTTLTAINWWSSWVVQYATNKLMQNGGRPQFRKKRDAIHTKCYFSVQWKAGMSQF